MVATIVGAVVEAYLRTPNAEAIGDRPGRFVSDRAFAAMVAAIVGAVVEAYLRTPNAEAIGDRPGRFVKDSAFAAMVDAVVETFPGGNPAVHRRGSR